MSRFFEKISLEQYYKDCKKLHPNMNEYEINNLYENIKLPQRGTQSSAGYDFFSPISCVLPSKKAVIIPTGIKASMETDEVLMMHPRSSLGFKFHIQLANTIGIIDSDYYNNADNEGHILIKLYNDGDEDVSIDFGKAFCQGIFMKYLTTDDDNSEGVRSGGIGSTDNN